MKRAKRYIKVILILFLKRLSFGGNCTIFGPKMTFTHNSGSALNDFFTMKWVHLTLFYSDSNIYIYIYSMVFTTEGFLEVAIESWPEWDLNHDH